MSATSKATIQRHRQQKATGWSKTGFKRFLKAIERLRLACVEYVSVMAKRQVMRHADGTPCRLDCLHEGVNG